MSKQVKGVSEKIEACAKKRISGERICGCIAQNDRSGSGYNDRFDLFALRWKRRIIFRYRRTGSERIYREVCKCAGEIPCDRPG